MRNVLGQILISEVVKSQPVVYANGICEVEEKTGAKLRLNNAAGNVRLKLMEDDDFVDVFLVGPGFFEGRVKAISEAGTDVAANQMRLFW